MARWAPLLNLTIILGLLWADPRAATAAPPSRPARTVAAIPDSLRKSLNLPPFYQQHVDATGIPVLGSAKVSRAALLEAAFLIDHMLEGRDDIRRAIADAKVRVTVMAVNELTCDVPEHSDLRPREEWNLRARGLGATRHRPCTSCGEENLLELRGDPYRGESILIHEFGHTIHGLGLTAVDRTFDARLRAAYQEATGKGLWKGTYAGSNAGEYWAEGVQSWFDCNQSKNFIHNGIRTRQALKEYDPGLATLLAEVFGDRAWRYEFPATRSDSRHLSGQDRSTLPAFRWPEELLQWKREQSRRETRP